MLKLVKLLRIEKVVMESIKKLSEKKYDVVVVGGGIVGLASAYAAVKKGLSVALVERESQNKDASVRNFGFVTVSGQQRGTHWQRAIHTRDVWADIVPKAGIEVEHSGLHMLIQPTPRGDGCR